MKISEATIDEVSRVHVLELAQRMGHWTKVSGSYTTVYCPNPNHHENTPDCKIKNTTGVFNCFGGGGCGAKGGALQYYAWATYGSWNVKQHFRDTVKGICEIMGIPLQYENGNIEQPTGFTKPYEPKPVPESIPARDPEDCDRVYRRFLQLCPLYREHAEEWITKRKYTKQQILAIGLKSIPKTYEEKNAIIRTLIKEGYDLERIPGFTRRLRSNGDPKKLSDWYWSMNAFGKYFIPVRDDKGHIVRLRLATGDSKKKYTWFSSEPTVKPLHENGEFIGVEDPNSYRQEPLPLSRMQWGGCSSSHHVNIVIPASYLEYWEAGDEVTSIYSFDYVLITEGEHKANIVASMINTLVIGVPGVGLYKEVLPLLRNWGVKKLVIAYDADAFTVKKDEQEQEKANAVFKNLIDFSNEILESDGIELHFWIWNIADGKGLDDLLISGKKIPIDYNVATKEKKPCDFIKVTVKN